MSLDLNAVQLTRSWRDFEWRLCIAHRPAPHTDGRPAVVTYAMREIERGTPIPDEAALPLNEGMCQALIDELWRSGFRPTHARAGDAQIEALSTHLADMRCIVAHKLGVNLNGSRS